MQEMVNHFKDDPNVVVLFIHTFERSKTALQDAKELIAKGGYNFKVLMDTQHPETKANEAAKAFGIRSIPTKIIIDGNGRIRYSSSGGSRDPKTVVDEFSKMLEMLKGD